MVISLIIDESKKKIDNLQSFYLNVSVHDCQNFNSFVIFSFPLFYLLSVFDQYYVYSIWFNVHNIETMESPYIQNNPTPWCIDHFFVDF